jgi:hypothetical protein
MASLHIEKEFDDMLNELKTIHDMDKKKIVQLCIRYIYKNKINPENIKPTDSAAELKALRNSLVGFIKTQEKEKLDPILQKLDYVIEKLNKAPSTPLNSSNLNTNPTADQFKSLVEAYKKLVDNQTKLVEHYNSTNIAISKKLPDLTEEIKILNVTVENKLSKRLL